MKIFKLALGMAAGLLLASCNINELPEYDDSNAFVAFTSTAVTAQEGGDDVEIPVLYTSLSGLSAEIEVEVIDSTAVEGKDFTVVNKKLSFTKENPTQKVVIKVTNDDTYTGSRAFTLVLKESGVQLGASKKCVVSIADDEHPLLFLFNTYTTHLVDYWGDEYDIEGTITRDSEDDTKVWFNNIFTPWLTLSNGFNTSFYGLVNLETNEILIPAGQDTGVKASGVSIVLYVGESEELSNEMYDSGKNLIVKIVDNGESLVIVNTWGASNGSSWYDRSAGGVTLTKKK